MRGNCEPEPSSMVPRAGSIRDPEEEARLCRRGRLRPRLIRPINKGERQTPALADDRTEHETRCSQCEHEELKGSKCKFRMTPSFEPGDQAYLD
jgi:hypothetical protein